MGFVIVSRVTICYVQSHEIKKSWYDSYMGLGKTNIISSYGKAKGKVNAKNVHHEVLGSFSRWLQLHFSRWLQVNKIS